MKKAKKLLKTGILAAVILLAAGGGYFWGSHSLAQPQSEVAQTRKYEDSEKGIAVVDMDEGIEQNGETIQYASKILPYSGVEYTVTGLQDARNGVKTGLYHAYVVIPSDFSKSVYSVNEQPVESSIAYTIDDKLDDAGREKTARQIAVMAQNMNDSLTKVYLSSVMKEFHSAQDATETIIKNDEKDAELLNAVDAGNLIELVELPETAEVENNITSLDLKKQYEKNADLVSGLGATYQEFIKNGQSDIDKTKERSKETLAKINEAYEALTDGNTKLSEFSVEKPDLAEQYKQAKEKLEEAIKTYDEYIKQYNEANAGDNKTALLEILKEYEDTETKYQDMLKPYRADSEYEFEDVEKYVKELSEMLSKELGEDVLADKDEGSWKAYLNQLTEKIGRKQYVQKHSLIDNCTKGDDISGEGPGTGTPEVKTLNEAIGDSEKSTAEIIRAQGEILVETSEGGQENIVQQFTEKKKALSDAFEAIKDKYQAAGKADKELNDELNAYNLTAYIENDKVDQITDSFQSNNQEIEQKVAEHTEESEEYVNNVYEETAKNITNVQENVEKAQEQSEKLLQDGLKEAKASRYKNKETNETLLREMTEKLTYTRIGDVENKEVYDFIAAPLAIKETVAEESDDKMAEETAVWKTEEAQKQEQSNRRAMWLAVLLLVGGIGAAVLLQGVLSVWRHRRKEEF